MARRLRKVGYRIYAHVSLAVRRRKSFLRMMPTFVIIGAQKGGTASLFAYLTQHPNVVRSFKKEVHYFDLNYEKGEEWYRAHFPLERSGERTSDVITGEATPYYLFHPHVPGRMGKDMPQVRLITLLRDPVQRAFSQYQHSIRRGTESRSFEDVLRDESVHFGEEFHRMMVDVKYDSALYRHKCYLARGRYLEQLERWSQVFPRSQLLVLRSEDLFRNPEATYRRVTDFLDLEPHSPRFSVHNRGGHRACMNVGTETWLREYYRPFNEDLSKWLGMDEPWWE